MKLTKREIMLIEKWISTPESDTKTRAYIGFMWANWSNKHFEVCLRAYKDNDYKVVNYGEE